MWILIYCDDPRLNKVLFGSILNVIVEVFYFNSVSIEIEIPEIIKSLPPSISGYIAVIQMPVFLFSELNSLSCI